MRRALILSFLLIAVVFLAVDSISACKFVGGPCGRAYMPCGRVANCMPQACVPVRCCVPIVCCQPANCEPSCCSPAQSQASPTRAPEKPVEKAPLLLKPTPDLQTKEAAPAPKADAQVKQVPAAPKPAEKPENEITLPGAPETPVKKPAKTTPVKQLDSSKPKPDAMPVEKPLVTPPEKPLIAAVSYENPFILETDQLQIWTDASGNYRIEARFVGFDEQTVRLRKPNGQYVRIAYDRLSLADRQRVQDLSQAVALKMTMR